MVHAVCWGQTTDKVVTEQSLLVVTGNDAEQGVWVTQLGDLHELLKGGIWTRGGRVGREDCKPRGRRRSCVALVSMSLHAWNSYSLPHHQPHRATLPSTASLSSLPPRSPALRTTPGQTHLVKAKYMRLMMVKLSRVMVCGR